MPPLRNAAYPLTWVTDHLGVGPAPMSYAALDSLREQGVGAILNLCGEFTDLHEIEAKQGFEVYHLPTEDEQAPDLAELEKALAWLDEAIYLGKKVLIHCRHGIGRTGTVLNAYLLRRGLGHFQAWKTLRALRSQPANFLQWRAVRRYGKKAMRLKVREPSLEHRCQVDMRPFFADYQQLVDIAEQAAGHISAGRCGQGHTRCCHRALRLMFGEAVHINTALGAALTRAQRAAVIKRGADLAQNGGVCPLLEDGACLAFALRPLACRVHDLPEDARRTLWDETLVPALEKLSRQVYQSQTGQFMPEGFPAFDMGSVVTGRYVQAFFDWQRAGHDNG
ncbi:MAG: dual specificity protein phosphatase family protein [Humidesulfovibrio sp.]|nr:dual specificity protein phosphatase family protein [Humidesulfovibrio sp.]